MLSIQSISKFLIQYRLVTKQKPNTIKITKVKTSKKIMYENVFSIVNKPLTKKESNETIVTKVKEQKNWIFTYIN